MSGVTRPCSFSSEVLDNSAFGPLRLGTLSRAFPAVPLQGEVTFPGGHAEDGAQISASAAASEDATVGVAPGSDFPWPSQ